MTIRLRLTLYWAAVLAAIILAGAIAVEGLFASRERSALQVALAEEADTTAEEIHHAPAAVAPKILERLSRETDIGPGRRVRLISSRGVIADFGDPDTIPPALPSPCPNAKIAIRTGGAQFAIVPLAFSGERACLESGVSTALVNESIAHLRASLLLMTPLLLLLCVAGGYWLAGRALFPIEALTMALAAIGPANLSSRLPVAPAADEIARLSAVVNGLLDRIERAAEAERRFASDAAHELRTPLAVLRTELEVALARERGVEESRAALAAAHRETVALCKIAEELLMLARLGGETAADRARIGLRELAGEVLATVEPLAQARETRLILNAPAEAFVTGNAGQLRRLLINLLDNALKFTPARGAIQVAIARDGGAAILRVADSGPGIAPADLPHVFDRFFRGKAAPGEGSGLGLSICREIARLHGGEISAANRPEGGCEITVKFPLAPDSGPPAA